LTCSERSVVAEIFVVTDAIDPDHAVFDIHFIGDVVQPVNAFAEVFGDAVDCPDVVDLVDVHGQAAWEEMAGS
jgi:hypothetical protein